MNKIKQNIVLFFFVVIISFLLGYLGGEVSNFLNAKYVCEFSTSQILDENKILSENQLRNTQQSAEKYSEINIEGLINEKGIYLVKEENYKIYTYSRYYNDFFFKSQQTVSTRAKTFIKDLLTYQVEDISFANETNIITKINDINSYLVGAITFIIGTLGITIYLILSKKQINDNSNKSISIFTLEYWRHAISMFSNVKKLVVLSLIFALLLITKMIHIPSGFATLGIGFAFIVYSIIGMMYGPIAGLMIGIFADILGYFLFDTSGTPFFIGYIFQAMVSGFIHGIFLYKKRLSFFRILSLRIAIALICNVIIGSFCWGIMLDYTLTQTLSYMLLFIVPKNIIYLIPQSIILFLVIKLIVPLLIKFNYLDKDLCGKITIL